MVAAVGDVVTVPAPTVTITWRVRLEQSGVIALTSYVEVAVGVIVSVAPVPTTVFLSACLVILYQA
jgi:hypothetical protein